MSSAFVSCPVDVFRTQVSPTAYKVFLVLKSFDNKEHKIFPSKKTLAEKCGLGLTSIYKAIKQLVKAGFVTVVSRFDCTGRQTSNFYQITAPVELKVYSCLSRRADENGQSYPSRKQIAKECHLSVTTVYRTIHRLKQKGFLRIERQTRPNGGTKQNLYTLLSVSQLKQGKGKVGSKTSMSDLREQAERAEKFVAELVKKYPMVYEPDFIRRE